MAYVTNRLQKTNGGRDFGLEIDINQTIFRDVKKSEAIYRQVIHNRI